MTSSRLLAALVCVAIVPACDALFGDPSQCSLDRDCSRFGAVCDVARHVCVASSEGPTAPAGADPTPQAESLSDAAPSDGSAASCDVANKPVAKIGTLYDGGADAGATAEITKDTTLDCTKDWTLDGPVVVRAGATLTIGAGTTIHATPGVHARLEVLPGGRLVAAGQRDAPIVFTSAAAQPAASDWGGVVLLGFAPPSGPGVEADPSTPYGGTNADDDSGVITFVRIEYAAISLSLGGVGRKTKIDSVEARMAGNDAFSIAGGTVDMKHLVVQYPGDEMLQISSGYAGRIQFFFGQKSPLATPGHNGLLTDGSYPVVYNATLCGDALGPQGPLGFGVVFRNGSKLGVADAIVVGWAAAVDARDAVPAADLEMQGSVAFGNAANPAYVEDGEVTDAASPYFNNDLGFDEVAWFRAAERGNVETDPGLVACFDPRSPKPYPALSLTKGARTPPNDGFFEAAPYIGAFRDAADPWMAGAWARFADK